VADTTAAPTPATALAVRERGYTTDPMTANFWGVPDLAEHTPELRWPLSVDVFDAMSRQDAQVSSVFRAVTTPILRTQWRVDGTGCRPEVTAHVASDLGLPIVGEGNDVPAIRTRDRFSWPRHLRLAMLMLRYGHSYFEQVYRVDSPDGLAHLRKLGWRPPKTIAKFNVARDGGLVSIEQYGAAGLVNTITLPVSRLVAYVHDQEGGNWIGQSLLRPAYKNWLLKDRLLRVDTQSVERNGMGIPVYTGAPNETDLDAGQEIAENVRSGDNSGAAIPQGAKLELQGVTGTLPKALDSVKYHDEQIARAVLAHFLNLGSQTGSWALGSTFADFFTLSLQSVAEEIRDTATMHVVEDLVDLNYGPTEPAPRLVFDEIGSNRDAIVQAIATLVGAGVLHADEDLEQFVRTAIGLPAYAGGPAITPPVPVPVPAPTQEAP
jgi:hypothetical protein